MVVWDPLAGYIQVPLESLLGQTCKMVVRDPPSGYIQVSHNFISNILSSLYVSSPSGIGASEILEMGYSDSSYQDLLSLTRIKDLLSFAGIKELLDLAGIKDLLSFTGIKDLLSFAGIKELFHFANLRHMELLQSCYKIL
nr:hypothetical protein CFP56_49244 [Quercus suber]